MIRGARTTGCAVVVLLEAISEEIPTANRDDVTRHEARAAVLGDRSLLVFRSCGRARRGRDATALSRLASRAAGGPLERAS